MSDDDFPFRHRLAVRFGDCDMMGHVNHATYFTYLEECRFALWRFLAGGSKFPGVGAIMVHAECDYRAPAFLHDELEIGVRLERLGTSSFTFFYKIVNASTGRHIADGRTVNATFDHEVGKTVPMSAETRALLERVR